MLFKSVVRPLVLTALVLVIMFQALILGLPALVQTLVETRLPQSLAGSSLGFKIQKIGLFQALVSQVSLGQDLSADLVEVRYRLKNFKEFHLERIIVYGLNLHVQMDADDQLFFNGAPFPGKEISPGPGSDPGPAPVPTSGSDPGPGPALVSPPRELTSLLGFLPDQIVVKNGFVSVTALDSAPPLPLQLASPLELELLKTTDTQWTLALSPVHLAGPGMPWTQIDNFRVSMELGTETFLITGGFDLAGSLVPAMGALFELKLDRDSQGLAGFDLTLKNRRAEAIRVGQMGFHDPTLLFSLKGTPRQSSGQVEFACKDFTAGAGDLSVSIKNINLHSSVQADFSHKGKGMAFDIRSTLSSITLSASAGRAGGESLLVAGKAFLSKQFVPRFQGEAQLKNGTLDFPELKVAASQITARIPLGFPFKKGGKSGTFSMPHLVYDQKLTAGLQGEIFQSQPLEMQVRGLASLPDFPGLKVTLGATAGMDPAPYALLDFNTEPYSITGAHGKKIWPPLVLSPESSIEFLSQGTLSFQDHGLKTRASVQVTKGNLFFPDMDLNLTGIAGAIEFTDLIQLESLPGQEVTIDRIQADQFVFDRARLRFSIEDGRSLNIENLGFHWCNGIVSTESVRLPPQENHLRLILYCDRLELSPMLKQMGAFHAEGEGTLNGRIPMVYQDGNISFDKGFLFSTPGKGGRVVIENSDKIMAGIPLNTPEFSQLDLAREALKDFEYTWAKLELNTFEDTLHVNMEMDGKPAGVLPFEYKKEVNSFVRVDASSPGSRFQGIRMDVNLKLPFNQVLKYGNRIKKLFD